MNSRTVGVVLAAIAGLIAVAVAILVSHEGTYLWGIILVCFVVEEIQRGSKKSPNLSLAQGIISAIGCLCVAAVIYFLNGPSYLWAMLLVALFSSSFATALT